MQQKVSLCKKPKTYSLAGKHPLKPDRLVVGALVVISCTVFAPFSDTGVVCATSVVATQRRHCNNESCRLLASIREIWVCSFIHVRPAWPVRRLIRLHVIILPPRRKHLRVVADRSEPNKITGSEFHRCLRPRQSALFITILFIGLMRYFIQYWV